MSKKRSAIIASLFLAALFVSVVLFRHFSGNENQRFEAYTKELFRQEVAGSTISLHYTLKNPKSYGIEQAPITFGYCTTDTTAICASAENAIALLHSFDRNRLSKKIG